MKDGAAGRRATGEAIFAAIGRGGGELARQGFRLDAAVYFRFEDGLITRIEEYAGLPSNDAT